MSDDAEGEALRCVRAVIECDNGRDLARCRALLHDDYQAFVRGRATAHNAEDEVAALARWWSAVSDARAPIGARGAVRMSRLGLAALLLVASLGIAGCAPGSFTAAAPGPCREVGAQCPLAGGDGALGVCERATCSPGESAPCFECTPQH